MRKFWIISNLVVLGLLLTISLLGTFYKHISFGWGLGDIFGYAILYLVTALHIVLTVISRNKGKTRHISLTTAFFIITIWISLKATVFRGPEYSWNNSLFYMPCPSEIQIKNRDIEKKLMITMCSMEYYSDFSAVWDGQFMKFDKGELKIPNELIEYIDYPIKLIEIEPSLHNRVIGESERKPRFTKDTLSISKVYELKGEIIGVNNSIPVFQVKIK